MGVSKALDWYLTKLTFRYFLRIEDGVEGGGEDKEKEDRVKGICDFSFQCYSLERKNLQTLAMKLGVQARNLHNELKFRLDRLSYDVNAALGWLPNDVLSYASALVDDTKEIVNWLDR